MGNIVNVEDSSVQGMDVLLEKEKYTSYILEHQKNVMIAYLKLFTSTKIQKLYDAGLITSNTMIYLREAIQHHDESKFSDEEFESYRRKFNATEEETNKSMTEEDIKILDQNYQNGWAHHYLNNDHHPRYWKNRKIVVLDDGKKVLRRTKEELAVATDMTPVAILHMICDWEAMGIKFGSNTIEWYRNDADEEKRDMSPATKEKLEKILCILYDVDSI